MEEASNSLSTAKSQLSDLEKENADLKQRLEETEKKLSVAVQAEKTLKSNSTTSKGRT